MTHHFWVCKAIRFLRMECAIQGGGMVGSGPDPDWISFSSTEARWINFNPQMRAPGTKKSYTSLYEHRGSSEISEHVGL